MENLDSRIGGTPSGSEQTTSSSTRICNGIIVAVAGAIDHLTGCGAAVDAAVAEVCAQEADFLRRLKPTDLDRILVQIDDRISAISNAINRPVSTEAGGFSFTGENGSHGVPDSEFDDLRY